MNSTAHLAVLKLAARGAGLRLPELWWTLFMEILAVDPHAILAGGALRDAGHGKTDEVKDLDFFVSAETDLSTLECWLAAHEYTLSNSVDLGSVLTDEKTEVSVSRVFKHPQGGVEVNVIWMADGMKPSDRVSTFDFGICQIALSAFGPILTQAFHVDAVCSTFTLISCPNVENFGRSMRRFERLRAKYPKHALVIPPRFAELEMHHRAASDAVDLLS